MVSKTDERLEALEGQVNDLIKAVNILTTEFREFREETRKQNSEILSEIRLLGARIGNVENRLSNVEARITILEEFH
ncbi:MAG: hypothetical protein OXG88_10380 [Gammaproteobacteria bacterium]|nr:hypothetical protein [Gammaproteobacteria bacterium]